MVVIRLARAGSKKKPFYPVVVADARAPRDGRYIEKVGYFNPNINALSPDRLQLNLEKIERWCQQGAHLTDTVKTLIKEMKRIPEPTPREKSVEKTAVAAKPAPVSEPSTSTATSEGTHSSTETNLSSTDASAPENTKTNTSQPKDEAEMTKKEN